MPFLSELLNASVLDSRSQRIGKLTDLIASIDVVSQYPPVRSVVVGLPRRITVAVPWKQVAILEPSYVKLSCSQDDIVPYEPAAKTDLHLARDILDKQIVDIDGARIVRVNDLQLVPINGGLCLAAVDSTARGLLRRIGLGGLAKQLGKRLPAALIKWEDLDIIPSNVPTVQLKAPFKNLSRLHPAEIAEVLSQLGTSLGRDAIEAMSDETVARAMAEVEPELQVALLERMDSEKAADILDEMAPDDAADVLQDFSSARAQHFLRLMEHEAAQDAIELMAYPEDSAGGLMTTDCLTVSQDLSADQVINRLRELAPDTEVAYYVYVTDAEEHLLGVISLRDLIVAQPETKVADFMHPEPMSVNILDDTDEVMQVLTKYNLLAVPVVDFDNRLQGMVAVNDVIDETLPEAWKSKPTRISG